MRILQIPDVFRPEDRSPYPRHQTGLGLEDRAEEYFKAQKTVKLKRIFFPVKWTAYQIDANYGHDDRKMAKLRNFCKGVFGNGNKFFAVQQNGVEKYFTIAQYDDGCLVDMGKNCRIFGAGGVGTDAIPLTTERHPVKGLKKEILCSFLGSMGTHAIRKLMYEALKDQDMFVVKDVYTKKDNTPNFAEVTERSCFTLCPRGYGKTSFRLYEAMQLGSVPIYLSDVHWLPYKDFVDWSKFCLVIGPQDLRGLPQRLAQLYASGQHRIMAAEAKRVYEEYFCFEQMFKWVLKILENEK